MHVRHVTDSSISFLQNLNHVPDDPVPSTRCGNVEFPKHEEVLVTLPQEKQHLTSFLPKLDYAGIERKTRDQASCELWKQVRKPRVTASNFSLIHKRKKAVNEKMLKNLFQPTAFSNEATTHGNNSERIARESYIKKYPERHCHSVGLVINKEFPFLGASPDNIVCHNEESGLMEVRSIT